MFKPDIGLNPFHATDLFWYSLKTPENQAFSGVLKEISGMKWVKKQCFNNDSDLLRVITKQRRLFYQIWHFFVPSTLQGIYQKLWKTGKD